MTGISDLAMRTMQATMRGLQERIDVRAHNVANSSTPGYRAQQVDFETELASALARGREPLTAAPATTVAPNLANAQGNTVDLGTEMVGMVKDNLAYDTAVNVFNYKAQILGTALRGQ